MKIISMIAAFAVVASLVTPVSADEMKKAEMVTELGPSVGSTIPHDLSAQDYAGDAQTFDEMAGENGIALFFIRSVDWCPFCKAQAIDINENRAAFEERGLNVVFVSYDAQEKQNRFVEHRKIQASLLSDQNSEIIDAFGLRNLDYGQDSMAHGAPYPAVFIINNDREIVAKLYEDDYATNKKSYRNRPAVEIILDAVDQSADKL